MVDEDPHITIREISERTELALGTAERILRDDLDLRKVTAKWVPHLLTESQKQRRVECSKQLLKMFGPDGPKRLCDVVTGDETWINVYGIPNKRSNQMWLGAGDARPVVLRPDFQSRKRLFTIFFSSNGQLVVDTLPENTTLNSTYYVENCLHKLVQSVTEQRPTVGLRKSLLLHDNASPHKAKVTATYLVDQGLQVLPHLPYSPDLAPCDFWLFPLLKGKLAGRKFFRIQDLSKAVNSELRALSHSDYQNAFDLWLRRLKICMESGGEYFEGM